MWIAGSCVIGVSGGAAGARFGALFRPFSVEMWRL